MWCLGDGAPVEKTLIPAEGERPAVTVTFNPLPSPLSLRAARRAAAAILRAGGSNAQEEAADAFSAEVIRHNIRAWSGIGDASGAPVLPTLDVAAEDGSVVSPGTITAFLAEPRLFEAADREYVIPWAVRDAEGNGFAPSPSGTSAGATQADDTASFPATSDETADAATTTPAPPPAPTKSKRAARMQGKRSGS